MSLTLYELPPSPNSIKVRLALGLKGIECVRQAINPADRAEVVKLSGQPLTPVLTDAGKVIYDSYAILRYLDANFRDQGPRLYSSERAAIQTIETWELFARCELGEVIGLIFGQLFAPSVDPAVITRANALFAERAAKLEAALDPGPYLCGAELNAADLTAAPFAYYGTLDPAQVPAGSIEAFFAAHLRLPEAPRTRAWIERVMALDCARA